MFRKFVFILLLTAWTVQAQEALAHPETLTLIIQSGNESPVNSTELANVLDNLDEVLPTFVPTPILPPPNTTEALPSTLENLCKEQGVNELLDSLCGQRDQALETLVALVSQIVCNLDVKELGELVVLAELVCGGEGGNLTQLNAVIPSVKPNQAIIPLDPPSLGQNVTSACSNLALVNASITELTPRDIQTLEEYLKGKGFTLLGADPNDYGTDMAKPKKLESEQKFIESAGVTKAKAVSSNVITNSNNIIAILDTGFDPASSILISPYFYDLVNLNSIQKDRYEDYMNGGSINVGHGTPIAHIAHTVAPKAELLPIRVCDEEGSCTAARVALGICYAVNVAAIRTAEDPQNKKNLIINMSLSGTAEAGFDPMKTWLFGLLKHVIEHDGVLVAAEVGNRGLDPNPRYPAAFTNSGLSGLVSVSGLETYGTSFAPAYYSTRGNYIDVAALGSDIYVGQHIAGDPSYQDGYSGNSFATPWVAGALALMLDANEIRSTSTNPNVKPLTFWEMEYCLQVTTQPPMPSVFAQQEVGAGMINMYEAVRCVQLFPDYPYKRF